MSLVSFSAPTEVSVKPISTQPVMTIGGVPMSMVDYFNLDYRHLTDTDKKQLNEIYEHLSEGTRPSEEVMSMLRGIELKRGLGSNDPRHSRVWRWIKINRQIRELTSQRDSL